VYCKYDYESSENKEAVDKLSENFPLFKKLSYKASLLVPTDNKDEFVKKVSTPGGVTQKILSSLDNGESLYDSLIIALDYIDKLNDMVFV
jgi:pyrroline-5-carboxylate reductase